MAPTPIPPPIPPYDPETDPYRRSHGMNLGVLQSTNTVTALRGTGVSPLDATRQTFAPDGGLSALERRPGGAQAATELRRTREADAATMLAYDRDRMATSSAPYDPYRRLR